MQLLSAIERAFEAPSVGAKREQWAASILKSIQIYPEAWKIVEALAPGQTRPICVLGTRRGAKSETLGRVFAARCILNDGHVHRSIGRHLAHMADHWWEREGDGGAIGIFDKLEIPYTTNRSGGMLRSITFPWESTIHLHPCAINDHVRSLHGQRADDYWIDEAQHVTLLGSLMRSAIGPSMLDKAAPLAVSGTAGEATDGPFAACAQDPQYIQIRLSSWRNPYLPGKDDQARWHRACDLVLGIALRREYGLTDTQLSLLRSATPDELDELLLTGETTADRLKPLLPRPKMDVDKHGDSLELHHQLLAQWLGVWTEGNASYVHPVSKYQGIYWGRVPETHGVDVDDKLHLIKSMREACFRLPRVVGPSRTPRIALYELYIGYDWGHSPDPAALWIGAVERSTGVCYEIYGQKRLRLTSDEQFAWLAKCVGDAKSYLNLADRPLVDWIVVMDAGGGERASWNDRLPLAAGVENLHIIGPRKADKDHQLIEINLMLAQGQIQCLAGNESDLEQRHLRYKVRKEDGKGPERRNRDIDKFRPVILPDGLATGGTSPLPPLGDHLLDARRYALYTAFVLGKRDDED